MSDMIRGTSRIEQINLQRSMIKRKRREDLQKADELKEELKNEEYFRINEEQVSSEDSVVGKKFINDIVLVKNESKFSKMKFDVRNLASNQFVAKYISELTLDEILVFFDDIDEDNINELYNSLLNEDEGQINTIMNKYFALWKLSIAQIYMIIEYLRGRLKKEKANGKLEDTLGDLLKKIEHQNSSYLLDFFDLAKHVKETNNHQLIHAFAALSSGELTIKTLRDSLQFINEALQGDFTQVVSRCINCRIGALARLTTNDLSLEEKVKLVEYYSFEKNLMILNSIYKRLLLFVENLRKNNLWQLDIPINSATVSSVLSFTESSIISEISLTNLLKHMQLAVNFKSSPGIINNLINLFSNMPMSTFNNSPKQYEKVLDGLRIISRNNDLKQQQQNTFSFIRETGYKKRFI